MNILKKMFSGQEEKKNHSFLIIIDDGGFDKIHNVKNSPVVISTIETPNFSEIFFGL